MLAVNARCLELIQDSDAQALRVDVNGNGTGIFVDTEATTADAINVSATAMTTGIYL